MAKYTIQTTPTPLAPRCPFCGGSDITSGTADTLVTRVGADREVQPSRCINGHGFLLASAELR